MTNVRNHTLRLALSCAVVAVAFAQGNESKPGAKSGGPKIEILEAPPYDCGGPDRTESISGKVAGAAAPEYRVAIYSLSCNGTLYVQPTIAAPLTNIAPDGSFEANVHLGQAYYVLLVSPAYKPQAELTQVPQKGSDIIAVAKTRGRGAPANGGKK